MKLQIAKACVDGIKRKGNNQDSIGLVIPNWTDRRPPFLVIADGMGGHEGGAVASQLVVEAFLDCYKSARELAFPSVLKAALNEAHKRICDRARSQPELAAMGSTVVAAAITPGKIYLINVGDSRAYLVRKQSLQLVSRDQSMVAEMVRRGVLSWKEAMNHPHRNQLSMSISARRKVVEPVLGEVDIRPGDRLLLCSDGLWSVVPEDQILYYVTNFPPQTAVNDLIHQACDYGGPDNISIILAQHMG